MKTVIFDNAKELVVGSMREVCEIADDPDYFVRSLLIFIKLMLHHYINTINSHVDEVLSDSIQ
jgi:hypothetical protein